MRTQAVDLQERVATEIPPPLHESAAPGLTGGTDRVRKQTPVEALADRLPPRARQFAGWFVLGLVAFGAEVAILGALRQGLHCPLWLASAIAAELVLLGRFLSTDRFVFSYSRPTVARCGRFHAAAVGSFAVSWLVLNGSATLLDVQYVVAAFFGSVAAFVWSGLSNFLWVWRPAATRIITDKGVEVESDWVD